MSPPSLSSRSCNHYCTVLYCTVLCVSCIYDKEEVWWAEMTAQIKFKTLIILCRLCRVELVKLFSLLKYLPVSSSLSCASLPQLAPIQPVRPSRGYKETSPPLTLSELVRRRLMTNNCNKDGGSSFNWGARSTRNPWPSPAHDTIDFTERSANTPHRKTIETGTFLSWRYIWSCVEVDSFPNFLSGGEGRWLGGVCVVQVW